MRWTLAAVVAAVAAGAGMTAPAARAHGDCNDAYGFARVEARRPETRRVAWQAAHYENRIETYVIREGHWREESVPATFGLRFDWGCRRVVRVVVSPASVRRTWVPAVTGERVVRVLVPGRWVRVSG